MNNRFFICMLCLGLCKTTLAQQDSLYSALMGLPLKELLQIKTTSVSKKEEPIAAVPASVVIVDRKEIENYGYQTLEDILQNIPGLYQTDDYYWLGTTHYGVRGFNSSSTFNNLMVLVNGVNQLEEYSRGTPLTKLNIPVEAIDKIEVVRGPMSVIYGSGAFLGVINILTNEKEHNEVGVSYGSANTLTTHIVGSKKVEDLFVKFQGGYYHTDGLDVPYTELTNNAAGSNGLTVLERNGLQNDARTTGQLKQDRVHFSINAKLKDFIVDFNIAGAKAGMMDGQPTLGEGSYFVNRSMIGHLRYHKQVTEKLRLQLRETYSYYTDYINYEQDYLFTTMGSTQLSSFVESELKLDYDANEYLSFSGGLYNRLITDYHWGGNYSYWGSQFDNFLTRIDKPFSFNAVYLESSFEKGKFKGIVGGRFEAVTPYSFNRYNDYDTSVVVRPYTYPYNKVNIIPRVALIYQLSENGLIKLLLGKAIKQPAMADLHTYALNPDWDVLIPPEIVTYEINYIANLFNKVSLSSSLFMNQLDNLITRKDIFNEDGSLTIESVNGGKQKAIGGEMAVKFQPSKSTLLDLSATYQVSEDLEIQGEDKKPGYSPNLLAYFKGSYAITNNLLISCLGRYVDRMETFYDNTFIDPMNQDLGRNGRIANGVDSYVVFDLNARMNEIMGKGFVEFSVQNVLDEEIRYPTTTANIWMDKGSLGPGRRIMISVGLKF
ncbi:MAG: TonB-dependent receptor plug domain-containing protein [Cyclobacteriaceae bacterium]